MLLKDATNQAAVDLFLRNLSFDFPATDIVGIPGDFVGLQAPHPGDKAIVFLHELEHIHSLTHPLGVLLSALGQRVLDLRNDLATRFKNLPDKDSAIQDKENISEELMTQALFTVGAAADWCEFRLRINMTVKLLQPLLEGLAMMTQMEGEWANAGWATLTILTLEYLYYEHRILLGHPELVAALSNDEERKIFAENLLYALERQVSYSRAETLDGNVVDTMFFEEDGTEEGSAAPYFYGYLYLRRLYQEWTERIPELNFTDFYYLATKVVCTVIPLTLLPLYSLRDHSTAGDKFPILFKEILQDFLSLPRSQIELLRGAHKLQIWNLATRRIEELPEQDPLQQDKQDEYEAEIYTMILGHVFDLREAGKSMTETLSVLNHIERAKFLFNTGKRYVVILGVDEEQNAAFIVDADRKLNESGKINFDKSGSTFFKFQDAAVFRQFLELVESGTNKLKRQRLGSAPYKFSTADYPVRAWLETFCYLWPHGVPTEFADDLPAAAIVRVLFCGEGSEERAFISGPPIRDLASVVKSRYWINRHLLDGIRSSLDQQSSVPLEISAIILHTYGEDSIAGGGARAVLQHYEGYESSPAIVESACNSVYNTLLFPAASTKDETILSQRKLDILIDDLQERDRRYLRSWMHRGLVLHPERSWLADDDTQVITAVERIRRASSARLGIPLVSWNREQLRVELDLIPNH
jgi:hypothetical protein